MLEEASSDIRGAEKALHLEELDRPTPSAALVAFTWDYYLTHPEFLTLVNSENLHKAQHIKGSTAIRDMHGSLRLA